MNIVNRDTYTNVSLATAPKKIQEAYAMNHLINAALVDKRFCELLISNPKMALDQGYCGERFDLAPREKQFVLSAGASSLPDFAERWLLYRNL